MQWFHRNPLKATSKLDFDLGLVIKNLNARKLASDATSRRAKLLELIKSPETDLQILHDAFQAYIDSSYGYVYAYSENGAKDESKIRFTKHIRWSNSIDLKGATPETHVDFVFEWASMLLNIALWYSKKAAKISSTEQITEEQAKQVHKCLKYAAGLVKHCKEDLYPKQIVQLPKESDGDPNILDAYIYQFSAEAQEVVMAQAIERGHAESLIAKLAFNTAETYDRARLCLNDYNQNKVGKWRTYCMFKKLCYSAYAYAYHVLVLLKEDKAGEAIACGRKAEQLHEQALAAAKEYSRAAGVGLAVKPADHLFFRNLHPLIQRNIGRAQSENSLIYHQKVPDAIADLSLKAEFGLATPEMPPVEFRWGPEWKDALDGFDAGRTLANILADQQKAQASKTKTAAEAPLEEVNEKPVYSTDKDPSTQSGCVLS